MSELNPFDTLLAGLIAKLSPQSRKSLAVAVSKRLRAGQQQHIKRQQAPDGTPYAPRKTRLRNKKRLRDRADVLQTAHGPLSESPGQQRCSGG
ncbi:phage virion morphogenesis protein [Serratia marcescens]|uniref:Phage virion morphogenesis protein n=1 Tax=Serratia marcescens TaxID=615 RepID=A0A379YH19_SERMA|nr:phage virion morphogenesis protein [Serratia marcescens]